ncbi:acyltransferase family protein [Helcobacillus massiliensis]
MNRVRARPSACSGGAGRGGRSGIGAAAHQLQDHTDGRNSEPRPARVPLKRPAHLRRNASAAFRDERRFRPELHGARGLAILLVVLFHIVADGRVSGGIDVFLAVTGFLALPSLLRRTGDGWRMDVAARLSALIRRLAVPILPMLLVTAAVGWLLMPTAHLPQLMRELRVSLLFHENIELVRAESAYNAAGADTSALQHLWSTGIQGQFHLGMIVLVMAVCFGALRLRIRPKLVLLVVLGALTIASLAWATHYQARSPETAYFSTSARIWELTLPGMVGLSITSFRLSPHTRGVLSWVGTGLIVSCGFVLDGGALFPGPAALWPVLGIVLVLIGGQSRTKWGADRLLTTTPLQRIGDISFSLYIWHWPILILTMTALDSDNLAFWQQVAVLAASLAMGALGKALFEDRLAQARIVFPGPRRSIAVGAAGLASIALLFTAGLNTATAQAEAEREEQTRGAIDEEHPGAVALITGEEVPPASVLPDLPTAAQDVPWPEQKENLGECVQNRGGVEVKSCRFAGGDPDGPLVVIAGGSHTLQWSGPIEMLAEEYGWNLVYYAKSYCVLNVGGDAASEDVVDPSCVEWSDSVIEELESSQPALVIAQATTWRGDGPENAHAGMADAVARLNDAGVPAYLVRQTPMPDEAALECVETQRPEDPSACSFPKQERTDPAFDVPMEGDPASPSAVPSPELPYDPQMTRVLSSPQYLCTEDACPAAIGNVRTLRDGSHITRAMARSLPPFIEADLREFRPELFEH